MRKIIFLDDIRNPFEYDHKWLVYSPIPLNKLTQVIWLKTYNEFVAYIIMNGLPDGICFDHDLSLLQVEAGILRTILPEDEKTGYDCAKWLVEYCMNNECKLPKWNSQSGNTVGKENINALLNNFLKHNNK